MFEQKCVWFILRIEIFGTDNYAVGTYNLTELFTYIIRNLFATLIESQNTGLHVYTILLRTKFTRNND